MDTSKNAKGYLFLLAGSVAANGLFLAQASGMDNLSRCHYWQICQCGEFVNRDDLPGLSQCIQVSLGGLQSCFFKHVFAMIYSRNFSCDFFGSFRSFRSFRGFHSFAAFAAFSACIPFLLFPLCYFLLIYFRLIYFPLLRLWACRD